MKKSRLMCIFLAVMMLSTSVFAATGSNVIKIDGVGVGTKLTVDVSYPTDHSGRGTIYIIPISESAAANNEEIEVDFRKAVYIGESQDISLTPNYEFVMPRNATKGIYLIVADGDGDIADETRSRMFYFNTSTATVNTKLSALNASTTKTTLEDGSNVAWYIDKTNPVWVSNADKVVALMNEFKGNSFASAAKVEEAYVLACHFAGPASYTEADFIADISYNNNILEVDKADIEYIATPEKVINKFRTLLIANPVSTKAEIQKLFRTACALTCISTTNRTTAIAELQRYNDIFELDFAGDFTITNPIEIGKSFEYKEYTSVAQVQREFEDAVANFLGSMKDPVVNPGGGNGGGGGTGGGGGGGTGGSSNINPDGEIVENLPVNINTFSDVPKSHWAYDYIEFVYDSSIMSGEPNGTFRPDDKITREEWTKVVLNAFGINTRAEADCDFGDVNTSDWFYPYVARAFELRIVNGITEETFGTGRYVSRQDAVVMFNRALSLVKMVQPGDKTTEFVDADAIEDYAKDAVTMFASHGIINGYEDGSFAPGGNITRAECAKIVKTLFDAIEI